MMSLYPRRRADALWLVLCAFTLLSNGCGGSSSSSNSDDGGVDATATPRPTPSPRATPSSLPGGTRTPTSPQTGGTRTPTSPPVTQTAQKGTPTPTLTRTAVPPTDSPTPETVTIIVSPGQSITAAAKNAPDGAIVVVAPGSYRPVVLQPGDLQGSVTLFADVTGEFTNSAAAPVTILASNGEEAAVQLFGQSAMDIDGFTLRGGTRAGFVCSGCSGVTVLDCVVSNSGGDAIRLDSSDSMLVFNNLLVGNSGGGVSAFSTTNLQVINNTIYNNRNDGILLSLGSTDAFVVNNILQKNTPAGIAVDLAAPTSLDGFFGDFNLNTNGYFGPTPGPHDSAADPLFIFPTGGDFHLAPGSQAIDSGTDTFDSDLVGELEQLTTQTDGSLDTPPLDFGYHYIAPIPTPTRAPKATRTPTPTATRTATRTNTPKP